MQVRPPWHPTSRLALGASHALVRAGQGLSRRGKTPADSGPAAFSLQGIWALMLCACFFNTKAARDKTFVLWGDKVVCILGLK